jgi:hypothetical protein
VLSSLETRGYILHRILGQNVIRPKTEGGSGARFLSVYAIPFSAKMSLLTNPFVRFWGFGRKEVLGVLPT